MVVCLPRCHRLNLVNRLGDGAAQDAVAVGGHQHVVFDADAAEASVGVEGVVAEFYLLSFQNVAP